MEEFVFQYFSQLNPIAHKIQSEINQTIENYEKYWHDMDQREQLNIINEAVIKPEIKMNYHKKEGAAANNNPYPYRDVDKNLLFYFVPKGPVFSFKTKSQLNLNLPTLEAEEEEETPAAAAAKTAVKPKTHQINKSTDSLTCSVNLVNLNVKPKKGRAPAAPTKMTTKPPPPPPPTAAKPVATPIASPVIEEIPKIPEDANSTTSLISPREAEVKEESIVLVVDSSHETDDEFKSLLSSNEIDLDFLKNW